MGETLIEEINVDKVLRTSSVDRLTSFDGDEATSKIVDEASAVRKLTEAEPGKSKSKPTECWLAYQISQLKERRRKLHSRVLRKSSAVNKLLYSVRNVVAATDQMLQIDGVFKILIEVHRD